MISSFIASTISGSGRGHDLHAPTINLNMNQIPPELKEGIYAGFVIINQQKLPAAIHYGPRPVFHDEDSFEVHVLDRVVTSVPETVEVELMERLRDVQNFASAQELMAQIQIDIEQCRLILKH